MKRILFGRLIGAMLLGLLAVAPAGADDNPYNSTTTNIYCPAALPSAGPALPLSTSAGVIRAIGNLPIQQQEARLVGEQANQAMILTRRMALNEGLYEMAQAPSYAAELDPWTLMQIRRDMTQPAESAIMHGDTLNRLLPYLRSLLDAGLPVPLSPDTLSQINVTVGTNGPSAGLLKDAGHLGWPLMLRGSAQQQFDAQLTAALAQTRAGTLTATTYGQLVTAVQSMQDDLRTRFFQGSIDTQAYQAGSAFLATLADSLVVLQRPDAGRFFDGTYSAQGNTVPDLVEHMAERGLQFAPASPGSEAAYFALHHAFVAYIRAAEASAFAAAVAPPQGP